MSKVWFNSQLPGYAWLDSWCIYSTSFHFRSCEGSDKIWGKNGIMQFCGKTKSISFCLQIFFYWDTQLKSNFRTLWHHACVPSKRKGLQVYIKITNYGQVETWVMSSYLWLQYLQLHDFAQLPYRHPDWKRFKSILILVLEYGSSKMEGIWCYKMKKIIQLTKNRYSYLSQTKLT